MAGCVQIAGQGSRIQYVVLSVSDVFCTRCDIDGGGSLPLSVPVLMPASGADLLMTTGEHHILFDVSHSCIRKIISASSGK